MKKINSGEGLQPLSRPLPSRERETETPPPHTPRPSAPSALNTRDFGARTATFLFRKKHCLQSQAPKHAETVQCFAGAQCVQFVVSKPFSQLNVTHAFVWYFARRSSSMKMVYAYNCPLIICDAFHACDLSDPVTLNFGNARYIYCVQCHLNFPRLFVLGIYKP